MATSGNQRRERAQTGAAIEPGRIRSDRLLPVPIPRHLISARQEKASGTAQWVDPLLLAKGLLAITAVTIAMGTVYYYNLFVSLDQDVHTCLAQIDRELQRRSDLMKTLLPPAFEYAALEREVFTDVSRLRTERMEAKSELSLPASIEAAVMKGEAATMAGAPVAQELMGDVVTKLFAVSEQYPDMKSGETFQMLMENLVEIENRLAEERRAYNDQVNFYTTKTASFPGKIFAEIFDFDQHELFKADPDARLTPVVEWKGAANSPAKSEGSRPKMESNLPEPVR